MHTSSSKITRWLDKAPAPLFVLYATSAAFITYFCMYAFRKPLTVGTFEGVLGWEAAIDFKTALVISQLVGYAASKWIGIKVVSEMTAARRAVAILLLIGIAEIALVLFAMLPMPFNLIPLFFNGLMLGMIWGLVFSYLEGRRTSEILGAGLATSFIVSSGVVKSVGKYLILDWDVSEYWMPALTGALFFIPLFIAVFFLSKLPQPTEKDEEERSARTPMHKAERMSFLKDYMLGLVALVLAYVIFTAFRDFRDNFAAEIWIALGFGDAPGMFTVSEAPATLIVLIVLGATMWIKSSRFALKLYHIIIAVGAAILALATYAFQSGMIGGALWMILLSLGLYLAYVPFNCILFDRMMAAVKKPGNAGFLIYLADASGYVGSVGLMLYKSLAAPELNWVEFLEGFAYITAAVGVLLVVLSNFYFSNRIST